MSSRIKPWRRKDKKHMKRKSTKPAKRKEKHLRDILEQQPDQV